MIPDENSPRSKPGSSPRSLELSRVQFIQQQFTEFLAIGGTLNRAAAVQRVYWIHDRLFGDGWTVETIRKWLNRGQRTGRIIGVTSGKGGVGKTTVSIQLAVAMARRGLRTLLFDGDLGMANVHIFAGITPRGTLLDVIDERASLRQIATAGPAGVEYLCGASGVARIADLDGRTMDSLSRGLKTMAAEYDIAIVDTGAGVGSATLHFLGIAHEVVVVTTPNLAATLDAYGIIKCMHERKTAAGLHLLVNLADEAKQAEGVVTRISGCAKQFLNREIQPLGVILRDPAIESANQNRTPISPSEPLHSWHQQFGEFAATLHPLFPDASTTASHQASTAA